MSGATRVSLIPISNPNRPGVKLRSGKPLYVTVHETANPAPGANAEMHRRFVHQGGGPSNVSFHYVVDDKESIQLLPDNEVGWHAGDGNGPGNHESVGIETCVNAGADFSKAVDNLVGLVKHLMVEFKIPVERVKQHHDFSSYQKNCPTKLRANNEAGWKAFIARLQSAPQPPQPPQPAIDVYAQAHPYVGLALEGEKLRVLEDGKEYTTRLYERALLHWRPGEAVGEARIGWMYQQAVGG